MSLCLLHEMWDRVLLGCASRREIAVLVWHFVALGLKDATNIAKDLPNHRAALSLRLYLQVICLSTSAKLVLENGSRALAPSIKREGGL